MFACSSPRDNRYACDLLSDFKFRLRLLLPSRKQQRLFRDCDRSRADKNPFSNRCSKWFWRYQKFFSAPLRWRFLRPKGRTIRARSYCPKYSQCRLQFLCPSQRPESASKAAMPSKYFSLKPSCLLLFKSIEAIMFWRFTEKYYPDGILPKIRRESP